LDRAHARQPAAAGPRRRARRQPCARRLWRLRREGGRRRRPARPRPPGRRRRRNGGGVHRLDRLGAGRCAAVAGRPRRAPRAGAGARARRAGHGPRRPRPPTALRLAAAPPAAGAARFPRRRRLRAAPVAAPVPLRRGGLLRLAGMGLEREHAGGMGAGGSTAAPARGRRMIPLEDALAAYPQQLRPLPTEALALTQSLNRVLAEPQAARTDLPRFDQSAMDGYAFRAADVAGASGAAPRRLPVAARLPAGRHEHLQALQAGTAVRILTGAPLPPGADTVIPQERVTREGETLVFAEPYPADRNIRWRGEELKRGAPIAAAGQRVTPGLLAALV